LRTGISTETVGGAKVVRFREVVIGSILPELGLSSATDDARHRRSEDLVD
jgi:hypothetical protein